MSKKEFSRFNKKLFNKTKQHTTAEPLTFEELAEMLTVSGDISHSLPMETIHKLWDCYIEMIGEVTERLGALYENLLIEFHGLHYYTYEKSDYFDLAALFSSDCLIKTNAFPTNDWNKYFAVN